jgi:hypothetical protein
VLRGVKALSDFSPTVKHVARTAAAGGTRSPPPAFQSLAGQMRGGTLFPFL